MAVAEVTKPDTKKTDKDDRDSGKPAKPGALAGAAQWVPTKWAELSTFFGEVRTELKKVTWPGKQEVYSTTIVIVFTTIFFGFYLWGVDILYTKLLARLVMR